MANLFTAYRRAEQSVVSTFTTPWIEGPEPARPIYNGKKKRLKAGRRGHLKGLQSRRVGRILEEL